MMAVVESVSSCTETAEACRAICICPQSSCDLKPFMSGRYNDATSAAFKALRFKERDPHFCVAADTVKLAGIGRELRDFCTKYASGKNGVVRQWSSPVDLSRVYADYPVYKVNPEHVRAPLLDEDAIHVLGHNCIKMEGTPVHVAYLTAAGGLGGEDIWHPRVGPQLHQDGGYPRARRVPYSCGRTRGAGQLAGGGGGL